MIVYRQMADQDMPKAAADKLRAYDSLDWELSNITLFPSDGVLSIDSCSFPPAPPPTQVWVESTQENETEAAVVEQGHKHDPDVCRTPRTAPTNETPVSIEALM